MNGNGFMLFADGESHDGDGVMIGPQWIREDLAEDTPVLMGLLARMQDRLVEKDVPRRLINWAVWPVEVVITEPRTTDGGPVASVSIGGEGSGLPPGPDPSA